MEGVIALVILFIIYRLVSSFLRYKKDIETTEKNISEKSMLSSTAKRPIFADLFMQGQYHHHLADSAFDRAKNLKLAIQCYQKSIEQNPTDDSFYNEDEKISITNDIVKDRIRIAQTNLRSL